MMQYEESGRLFFLVAECRSTQAVVRAWGMWVKNGVRPGASGCMTDCF